MDESLRRGIVPDLAPDMKLLARREAKRVRDAQRRAAYDAHPPQQLTEDQMKAAREARLDRWAQYDQALRERHRDDSKRPATRAPKSRSARQARNKAASHSRSHQR